MPFFMKPVHVFVALAAFAEVHAATLYRVENDTALGPAISAAMPGDVISVACDLGSYSIKGKHGAEGSLVTIESDKRLSRTVRGTLTIQDCSYIRLEGFAFAGFASNALKITASSHVVVTRNKFDFAGIGAANGIYTNCTGGPVAHLEVSYNEFNQHTAPGTWAGSYIKTWFNGRDVARDLWIHHNLFANVAPKVDKPGTASPYDGDSDREAIIFGEGDSQAIETNNLLEHNYFENCDGEDEMISFKTSKNVFRYNTVKNCMGSVHIRFGHGSEVYGNLFIGDEVTDFSPDGYVASANYESSGVVIYGTDHKVYNNHFQNLTGGRTSKHRVPLLIDSGDTDATTGNDHQRARRVLVCHNTFANCQYGIGVGLNYKLPPEHCIVTNNLLWITGKIAFRMSPAAEADTTCAYRNNLAWITGSAIYGTEKPVIKTDPLPVRATFNGFALNVPDSQSPVLDAGSGNFVTDDVFGAARTGTPDIGACELGAKATRLPVRLEQVGPAADWERHEP